MPTITGTIDLGGDARASLLALINTSEGTSLSLNDFVFSDPIIPSESNPIRNTKIKLIPKSSSGHYGVKTIWYNRIHVSELGEINVPKGSALHLVDLLPIINNFCGTAIAASEVVDYVLPAGSSSDIVNVSLVFQDTSLVFYGGTVINVTEGTQVLTPFYTDTVLFGNSEVKVPIRNNPNNNLTGKLFDQWSISIDEDFKRDTVCYSLPGSNDINADQLVFSNIIKNNTLDTTEQLNLNYPFVFSWINTAGLTRAITPFGEVMELQADGELWLLVGSIVSDLRKNTSLVSSITSLTTFGGTFVHKAAIDTDGTLYALFTASLLNSSTPSARKLYKSTNGGVAWTLITTVGNPLFTDSNYPVKTYSDMLIRGRTVYLLTESSDDTLFHGVNSYAAPVMETYSLDNNTYQIFSIGDVSLRNTEFKLSNSFPIGSKTLEFVNDPANNSYPRVVAYGKTKNTNHPFVGFYHVNNGVMTGHIVNDTSLIREVLSSPSNFAQSSSITLLNHPNTYLDVVIISHFVESNKMDLGAFLSHNELPPQQPYYTFGIKIFTSIRKLNSRSPWTATTIRTDERAIPSKIRLTKLDHTCLSVIATTSNLFALNLEYNTNTNSYTPTLRSIFELKRNLSPHSFNNNGVTHTAKHLVREKSGIDYTLAGLPAIEEASKAAIKHSLHGINTVTNENVWYTTSTNTVLSNRVLGKEYNFISTVPVLSVTDGGTIYTLTDVGTVLYSTTAGTKWNDYSVFSHIGKADYGTQIYKFTNYFGIGKEVLRPNSFVKGGFFNSFFGNRILAQITTAKNFELFNINNSSGQVAREPVINTATHGNILAITQNKNNTLADDANVYNSLKINSTNKIYSWDVNGETLKKVSSYLMHQKVGNVWNLVETDNSTLAIHPGITGTVLGVYTNLRYLRLEYAVLTRTTDGVNNFYALNCVTIVNFLPALTVIPLTDITTPVATDKDPVAYQLWDYQEETYVPFVICHDKTIYLTNRLGSEGELTLTKLDLTIPNDNGNALKILPMFNSNRFEYTFYQKANGVFELQYALVDVTPVITLAKIADTNTVSPNVELYTGSTLNRPAVIPSTSVYIPNSTPIDNIVIEGVTYSGQHNYQAIMPSSADIATSVYFDGKPFQEILLDDITNNDFQITISFYPDIRLSNQVRSLIEFLSFNNSDVRAATFVEPISTFPNLNQLASNAILLDWNEMVIEKVAGIVSISLNSVDIFTATIALPSTIDGLDLILGGSRNTTSGSWLGFKGWVRTFSLIKDNNVGSPINLLTYNNWSAPRVLDINRFNISGLIAETINPAPVIQLPTFGLMLDKFTSLATSMSATPQVVMYSDNFTNSQQANVVRFFKYFETNANFFIMPNSGTAIRISENDGYASIEWGFTANNSSFTRMIDIHTKSSFNDETKLELLSVQTVGSNTESALIAKWRNCEYIGGYSNVPTDSLMEADVTTIIHFRNNGFAFYCEGSKVDVFTNMRVFPSNTVLRSNKVTPMGRVTGFVGEGGAVS